MAGFENSAGIGVSNYYGARDSVGSEGITKTEGIMNEWTYDSANAGLAFGFPVPATGEADYEVVGMYAENGVTISNLDIGGVAVEAATEAVPVGVAAANTGVISGLAGGTGRIVIKYRKVLIA